MWLSLTNAQLDRLGGSGVSFIGLENYFGDYGLFFTRGNLVDTCSGRRPSRTPFSVCSVVLETALGLIVALVLNTRFAGWARHELPYWCHGPFRRDCLGEDGDWMLQQQHESSHHARGTGV